MHTMSPPLLGWEFVENLAQAGLPLEHYEAGKHSNHHASILS
jgi:hypothetical protein